MRPRAEVERLVREHQALVQVVAKRVARRIGARAELSDLLSLGSEALFVAAEIHDPALSRFPVFASKRIEWAMFDGIRRQTNSRSVAARALALLLAQPREEPEATAEPGPPALASEEVYAARLSSLLAERAAALAVGLTALGSDAGLSPEPSETPEEQALRAEHARHIRATVAALPERERALIERHYWGGEPFDAIAEELGVSKSWASRMHAAALQKLAQRLRE